MPRIISYNVRMDTPKDGDRSWPFRKDEVVSLLRLYRPGIFALQEPLVHQVDYIDEAFPNYARIGAGRDDGQKGGEFMATYYRKDLFQLLGQEIFWLSETPTVVGSYGWDARCRRIVVIGQFKLIGSPFTFYLYNTHFDHAGPKARIESAKLLRERVLSQVAQDHLPALITGDFNAVATSEVIRHLLIPDEGSNLKIDNTHQISRYPHHGPTGTISVGFSTISPDKIDYIFLCQPKGAHPTVEITTHAVLADHWDGRYPSDHLPVLIDFELR